MKKTLLAALIIACTSSSFAAPDDHTWYTGAKLGWSQYNKTDFITDKGYTVGNSTSDNQLGAGAFFGYQINPYLGFELGYDWFGRMTYTGNWIDGNLKSMGVSLTSKFSYPLTPELDAYTRLGGIFWRTTAYNDLDGQRHDTGVSPLAAIGLEYAFTLNLAGRLEYQWANHIGVKDHLNVRPNNGMLSAGISYRFDQKMIEPAKPVPVAMIPEPIIETQNFTLNADILFQFNKSILSLEGQHKLDELYNEISKYDLLSANIFVTGYTDRIGSDRYNMVLSEARAQSVVDYLVNKGIPAGNIIAEGRGKADSITGDTCDNYKGQALIDCLAPDRRIEIQIEGSSEVLIQPADIILNPEALTPEDIILTP